MLPLIIRIIYSALETNDIRTAIIRVVIVVKIKIDNYYIFQM
ncbi:MAG: hypothetical protein O7C60_00420 [Rickettsia endosymbiont of Ixodes persulcatus]|nr:hypothetical protein [Rickettsia endosymbiont of Ixodes persulcatus]